MEYEPDADMIFNYLMVSALAAATDYVEKEGLKPSGGETCYSFVFVYLCSGKTINNQNLQLESLWAIVGHNRVLVQERTYYRKKGGEAYIYFPFHSCKTQ